MNEQDMARRAFFNQRAHTWLDKFYKDPETGTHDRHAEQINKIVTGLNIKPDDRVLDVGCGSGVLVPYILDRLSPKGRLFEVDYAENMIEANQKEHHDKRISFIRSDVMDMPFEPFYFDAIACFACFPHFQDQGAALSKLSGLLKTGGVLAIAHLLSSKEIEGHHSGETAVSRDRLPAESKMKRYCKECDLCITGFKDEPGAYILSAKKKENPGLS